MRTTHIMAQSEKCLKILESIQCAEKRAANMMQDAKETTLISFGLKDWYLERAAKMQAVADRLTEYYFNQNAKLQQMVLKEQARIAADEIWDSTKAEVEQ